MLLPAANRGWLLYLLFQYRDLKGSLSSCGTGASPVIEGMKGLKMAVSPIFKKVSTRNEI